MDSTQSPSNQQCKQDREDMALSLQFNEMKITDLIDDCLEKIFEYLDLLSLFNVIVANANLRPAAVIVFKHKFSKNCRIHIDPLALDLIRKSFRHYILVNSLKTCLQYLRCLGSSISGLDIWYEDSINDKQYDLIHQYVNQYCANSLTSIKFLNFKNLIKSKAIPIRHFEKPFVNVHTVEVYEINMSDQFPLFKQWFPNIRTLKLSRDIPRGINTSFSFHHLKDLRLSFMNNEFYIARLLKLCPQLHSLDIYMCTRNGITLSKLSCVLKDNPHICNLKVTFGYPLTVSKSEIQQFVDEQPSLVELEFKNPTFTVAAVLLVVHQLKALKLFRCKISNRSVYDNIVSQLDSQWRPLLEENSLSTRIKLER